MKSRSLIFVISGIILLCLLLPTVSASTRTIIHPGAEVFIGEQQLNISATIIGTDAYIAWWASAADIDTTMPSKMMDVSLIKNNFFVSSSDFVGYTGSWYSWNGTGPGSSGWAFNVSDPQLGAVQIWDFSTTSDATDRAVARGDLLGFNITTNMYTHTNGHRSNAPGDVDANMKIRVKDPTSATYTSLDNDALVPQPLTQLVVGTQPWAWNGATVNMWATGAAPGGLFEYQPGTYTVWAESDLNGMKDNYRNAGADYTGKTVSPATFVTLIDRNLVAYYPFNGTANDFSGLDHDGTVVGATLTTDRSGNPNNAYHFDGWSWIEVPDHPDLKPANITVTAWINIAGDIANSAGGGSAAEYIVFKQNTRSSDFEGYDLMYLKNTPYVAGVVTSTGGVQVGVNTPFNSINKNTWYHVAVTADPQYATVYLNGVLQERKPTGFPLDYGAHNLFIGRTGSPIWDGYFNGTIDDIRIYNETLTDAQIMDIYNSENHVHADFTADVLSGPVPLNVQFTDTSSGSPAGWAWFFGDETYNTEPWTQQTASAAWSGRYSHSSVAMPDGSIVLMGGFGPGWIRTNDVWRSTDNGASWTQVNASAGWSGRNAHTSVVTPDGIIVLMGGETGLNTYANDVWSSTDKGATWTQLTAGAGWTPRYEHSSVILPDGSIVLMGGYDGATYQNDVWRSTDHGATWSQLTPGAGWPGRGYHSSVVMPDGSIVLMGGYDGVTYYHDVWRSTDHGATWTHLNDNAGVGSGGDPASVAMPDGSIVMMGGHDGVSAQNEVRRSMDNGAMWAVVNANPEWSGRSGHSVVAMPDGSIVLTGGTSNGADPGGNRNDVWRLNPVGSPLQNPSHSYTIPGTYQVALQVYNAGGYNSTIKAGYITATTTAPTTGSILITSTPASAAITLDDIPLGQVTSYTATSLWSGYHHVNVTLAGYHPQEKSVYVQGGVTTPVDFTLDPIATPTGSIEVTSNITGAAISIDGVDKGHVTNYTFNGYLGEHLVTLTYPGYFNASQQVTVTSGTTTTATIIMSPIPPAYMGQVLEDVQLVLKQELNDDTSVKTAASSPEPLPPSQVLTLWGVQSDIITPPSPSTIVFIDDQPGANWEHPVRYVFIDSYGQKTVINAMSPSPELAGVIEQVAGPIYQPAGENLNSIGSGSTPSTGGGLGYLNLLPACTSKDCSNNYAVLIDGGYDYQNNHIRYWNDISFMYQTLNQTYGYPTDHIRVYMSDGTSTGTDRHRWTNADGTKLYDSSPTSFDGNRYGNEVSGDARNATVYSALSNLGTLFTNKDIFIFTTGHGGWDAKRGESFLYGWNKDIMFASDFVSKLPPNAKSITLVMEQCNSGGFVNKFMSNIPTGQKRMIATASAYNQPSNDNGFSSTWTMAAAKIDSNMRAALLADTPAGAGDGKISVYEASMYARANDPYKAVETPQYKESPASTGQSQFLHLCSAVAPMLRLTSPSGGETWSMGWPRTISWGETGLDGTTLTIDLYKGSTKLTPLATGLNPKTGSFSWTPARTLAAGTDYVIKITSASPVKSDQKSLALIAYSATPGTFQVSSKPTGAAVYVDGSGTSRGVTPASGSLNIAGMAPGSHTIKLKLAGYNDNESRYSVASGKTTTVSVVLQKTGTNGAGTMEITSSPVSSQVIINGAGTGMMTPYTLQLDPGTYAVTVQAFGFRNPAAQTLRVFNGQQVSQEFVLTPGDTHRAVFRGRNASMNWLFDTNMDGVVEKQDAFGLHVDLPLTADFNRDGIMDRAVFRGTTKVNNWIIDYSMDGGVDKRDTFGKIGDIPLAGDFNKDGIMDRAVFRSVTKGNNWFIDYSMDGSIDYQDRYGQIGDIPVVGDFNKDGIVDRAVFREITKVNNWIIDYNMDGGVDKRDTFGSIGDIPLVGDFNKDGIMDRAVFRGKTKVNNWIIDYNMDGGVDKRDTFGKIGDIPVMWNA